MSKFLDNGPTDPKTDKLGRPEVQYVLVGTLIGAILFLILLSAFITI